MNEAALPAEPIPFRVLLDEAMKLTRRYFKEIYPSVAIPMALIAVGVLFVQQRFMREVQEATRNPQLWMSSGCLSYVGILLLYFSVAGLNSAVTASAAMDGARGQAVDMRKKWAFVLSPAVLLTLVLALIAVCVGFLFLVFPGIYIGLRLAFLVPVMAAEGLRGTSAMGRSWKLVRYNPGKRFIQNTATKVFLLYFVSTVIGWLASALIQLPFTALRGVAAAREISSGRPGSAQATLYMHWTQFPQTILSSLISTGIGLYASFGLVLLYLDVVRRKEGSELAAAIDARFGAPAGSLPRAPHAPDSGNPAP
jgi:hypothetical protein